MKFKAIFLTLLMVGLITSSAFAADPEFVLTEYKDVKLTPAAGETGLVVASFSMVTNTAAASSIVSFTVDVSGAGGGELDAADIADLAVYEDINSNGLYDDGVDVLKKAIGASPADGANVLTLATPEAFPAGVTKYYIVVADLDKAQAVEESDDLVVTVLCTDADANSNTLASFQTHEINIVATHFQWSYAANGLLPQVVTGADMSNTTQGTIISAVDDYGNLDTDYAGDAQIGSVDFTTGADTTANLTCLEGTAAAAAAANSCKVGGAEKLTFASGIIVADTDVVATAGAANEIIDFEHATAGPVTLVCYGDDGLEGSTTIYNDAYPDVTGSVNTTRGIEFYDTDNNGQIDRACIFLTLPIDGTTLLADYTAFTIADGYTFHATNTPAVQIDNGGLGIRNAGEMGITLYLNEKTTPDTDATPEVTYDPGADAIANANGGTADAVTAIAEGGAIEVDKARPQLMSAVTEDADDDGKIDAIIATFSEPVDGVIINPTRVATGGDIGSYSLAMATIDQFGAAETLIFAGTSSKDANNEVYTLDITEGASVITDAVPILLYNQYDVGSYVIYDFATDTQSDPDRNFLMPNAVTKVDTAADINVTDGVTPRVVSVLTDDTDGNGQVDEMTVQFSEKVGYDFAGVTFYTSVDAFGSDGGTAGVYDVSAATISGKTATYTIAEAATGIYDTEVTPYLYYSVDDGALYDHAGNEMDEYDATRLPPIAADNAAPVIVKVETSDTKTFDNVTTFTDGADGRLDAVKVIWSEIVTTDNMTADGPTVAEFDAAIAQFVLDHEDDNAAGDSSGDIDATGASNYDLLVSDATAVPPASPYYDADAVPAQTDFTTDDNRSEITLYFESINPAHLTAVGLSRNGGDTGVLINVAYTKSGTAANNFEDLAGTKAVNVAAKQATDTALPFVMKIETGDINGEVNADEDDGNGDGFLDNFKFYMSEISGITDALDADGFTIEGAEGNEFTPVGFDADGGTLAYATIGDVNRAADGTTNTEDDYKSDQTGQEFALGGANSAIAVLYTTSDEAGDPDTGDLPDVSYDGTNAIADAAGNLLAAFDDLAAIDKAKPVVVQAVGLVGSKKIYVTFSEKIEQTGFAYADLLGDVTSDYFNYDDRNDGDANDSAGAVDAVTNLAQTVALNESKITIFVDENLTVDDVESDYIWLDAAGIDDQAATANAAVTDADGAVDGATANAHSIMITIDDKIKPYIINAWTVDYDNDGWIDHIKLQLKDEDINVEAFGADWVDAVKANTTDSPAGSDGYADATFAATGWDIAGFTGEMWDFTFQGTAAAAPGAAGDLWDPADPTIVYIAVDENNAATTNTFTGIGDTDQAPVINSADAIFPKDFKGNPYTEDPEGDAVIDADAGTNITWALDDVGAVIMDGAFTTSQQVKFRLSEEIDPGSWAATNIFGTAFDLFVGTSLSQNWDANAKDIAQTADGFIQVDWTDDYDITSGNGGKIEWSAGGQWDDLAVDRDGDDAPNANIASAALVTLDAWVDPGTGVGVDPYVNLIAPNGNEVVNVGDEVKVVWSEANLSGVATIDVLVSLDGQTYALAAADANDLAIGTNVYTWTPTESQIGNVWIKVESSDGAVDTSLQAVKVEAAITGPAPVLTVLDPNGGDQFVDADDLSITVNWSSANFAADAAVNVYYQIDGGVWTEMVDPDPAAIAAAEAQAQADEDQDAADDAMAAYLAAKADYDSDYDELKAIANAASAASNADPQNAELDAAAADAWADVAAYKADNEPAVLALLADAEDAQDVATASQEEADALAALVDPADPILVTAGTFEWVPSSDAVIGVNLKVKVVSGDVSDMSDQVFMIYAADGGTGGGDVVTDIGAPSDLVLVDYPADQGNWFIAAFAPSVDDDVVQSYQFYREEALNEADPNDMTWVYVGEAGPGVVKNGKMSYLMSHPVNDPDAVWGVRACSASVQSGVGLKVGDMPVVALAVGAERVADGTLVSELTTAVGGPMDNIAPAAVTDLMANDNAGTGEGILVTWTASVDDMQVGAFGANNQYPIFGVNEYAVYRDGELVGSVTRGVTSFVDAVEDGVTAYQYMVKSVDDSGIDVSSDVRSAIATSAQSGDFNGDGMVDLSDFAIFGANYGSKAVDAPADYVWAYDLNADGTIDLSDFAMFGANYGQTLQVAKGVTAELPTADVMMAMNGEYDSATSTYKLHVNIGQDIDGFEFLLSYDTDNLEFTGDVTGLNGLPFASETEEGVVTVANVFAGEKFNGTVTLSFNTLSDYDDMIFSIDNARVVNGFDLAKVTDIDSFEAKPVPTVYTLSQNFPNPFNPTTTINYAIPANGHVELAIFNTAGQKVRTLVAQEQSAGFYKMVWDGRNEMGESVASGVYIYRLHSGSFSKTAKMNLIK